MMDALLRTPHTFLRRHLSAVERVMVAAGLALALYQLMVALPTYPSPWEAVIATAVFLVLLWSPAVAYFLAITAALYPLYSLSLYLAVLFVAVALLGHRVFIYNLGGTLLVLLTPWLAHYDLAWLAPLLGGLWWGKVGGAWIGGLAALWGQTLFGMTGANPDWLLILGTAPEMSGLFENFKNAGSLETLIGIVSPLAPDPTLLLYHLLQVTAWAMVAGLIGGIVERSWAQQKRPWRAVVIAAGGAFGLFAAHLSLAYWLEQYPDEVLLQIGPWLFQVMLAAAGAAGVLEAGRDFIEHPLPGFRKRKAAQPAASAAPAPIGQTTPQLEGARFRLVRRLFHQLRERKLQSTTTSSSEAANPAQNAAPAQYQPIPVPPNLPKRDPKKQRPDDMIKIELD